MTVPARVRGIFVWTFCAAALASCAPLTHSRVDRQRSTTATSAQRDARAAYLRLPLRFEPGRQAQGGEQPFVAHGQGFALKLSSTSATFALQAERSAAPAFVNMRLAGARPSPAKPSRRLQGVSHDVRGRDKSRWRLGIPGYAEVEYAGVYKGIDLVFYGNQQTLEYDFRVAPGADPGTIALRFDAAPRIDEDGNLVIRTAAGDLVQHAPRVYQIADGIRRPVSGEYAVREDGDIGFRLGSYDRRLPLVIDPILTYSTFIGGSFQERGNDVAIDSAGQMIIVGETFSDDFVTVSPAQGWRAGYGDVFVAKLTSDGSALVYATYLGGGSYDQGRGVAVDATGAAYVVGETFSVDFPATNSLKTSWSDTGDVFVAKLDAGGVLVYSTLVGGAAEDNGTAITVDSAGRAHIAGTTISADFPTAAAQQPSLKGSPAFRSTDGTMTWTGVGSGLTAAATLSFAFDSSTQPQTIYAGTELQGVFKSVDGGTTWTHPANLNFPRVPISSMAVGPGSPGRLYAATIIGVFRSDDQGESWADLGLGIYSSSVVVLPGAPSTVYAAAQFGWGEGVFRSTDGGATWSGTGLPGDVTILTASGSTVYAATVGGGLYRIVDGGSWTNVSGGIQSEVGTLAASPANPDVAYAGTFDALYSTNDGGATWTPVATGVPIAAVRFAPSDPATVYVFMYWWGIMVTHDGGLTWEPGGSTVTASPYAFAVDPTSPTTLFMSNSLAWDAFTATLSADGSTLERSTYLGGSNSDLGTGIAIDDAGSVYVVGETYSDDFPVRQAIQPAAGGLADVFVAKFAPDGSIAYATYLGGSGAEYASRIAVDGSGRMYVGGLTWSQNFPVFNAAQQAPGGGYSDVFVTALSAAGDSFVYSTYLGGSGMENDSLQSMGPDIAVTASGEAFVTGTTMSSDFPVTADAFQRVHAGGSTDGFVASFNAAGQLQYSTFFGAAGADYPRGIAAGSDGTVVIAGWTDSANLRIVDGVQPSYGGFEDAFLARIAAGSDNTDTTAPHSAIKVSGSAGLAGWYLSPVSVTVNAQDDPSGSGVGTIEYSLNGGPFQPYTGPFTVAGQGTTTVSTRATDLAGNQENPAPAVTVRVDSAGPVVTVASPQSRDYLHTDVLTVSVTANDATSGVAGAPTSTLDANPVATSTIPLLDLALGQHRFVSTASDAAGNSSQQSVTFRVVATIDSLIEAVRLYGAQGAIEGGTYRGLMAKLTDAKDAYARGNLDAARRKLKDFIDQCTAAKGNGVSPATADLLIADARWVLSNL